MTELGKRILAEHAEREELLLLHQEALLGQDLAAALARYEVFHDLLRAHVEFENRELLPRHAQVAEPRWRTQVYALEHDKILELAEKLHERLRQAVAAEAGESASGPGTGNEAVSEAVKEAGRDAGSDAGKEAGPADRLSAAPGQARRRWIIQLLDDERTLKNVLEHHEEREEKGMLPELGLASGPAA